MSFVQRVLKGLGGRPASDEDRRRAGRLPAHGRVLLLWQNTLNKDRQTVADVIEVSKEGISVVAHRAVPAGREAAVTNGQVVLSGVVRHCERRGRECTMGLEIVSRDELPAESPLRHPFSHVEL